MSILDQSAETGNSKFRKRTKFQGVCPNCHFPQWIDERNWNKDTSMQNCDYCKNLVEFTKVKNGRCN